MQIGIIVRGSAATNAEVDLEAGIATAQAALAGTINYLGKG